MRSPSDVEFHLNPLQKLCKALDLQNDVLGKARNAYLLKDAEKRHFESKLIQKAQGKSHAEKAVNAQATEDWLKFHKELARLEAVLEFQKLKYQIIDREFLAEHLAMKLDAETIKRG